MRTPRVQRGTLIPGVPLFPFVALFGFVGCGSTEPPAKLIPHFAGITLKIGAVGDPVMLAGAKLQRGEWTASREGALKFSDKPVGVSEVSTVDVFIFPGERMGDLVDAGALAVIPKSAVMVSRAIEDIAPVPADQDSEEETRKEPTGPVESFRYDDIAPVFKDQISKYGNELTALPYGGSAMVLVYRQDAFRREANRTAARDAGISLEVPKTWKEFEALARFFQNRDWDGDGSKDFGVSLALGEDTDGLANSIFLARAASPGKHRDYYSFLFDSDSMTPRLGSPPFVEALANLVELRECGPPDMAKFDALAAREAFRAGHIAMLIDRAERAATWSNQKPLGVAPLPGSDRVYVPDRNVWEDASPPNAPSYLPLGGGWLIGVRRGLEGNRLEAAVDFARFLADPENSNRVRADRSFSMLPTRISQMGQGLPDPTSAPDVDVKLWSDSVSRTLMANQVVPGLRIPQADGYLADLTQGRLAAMNGEPVDKAIQAVVELWTKRTATLGPKRQAWYYRRSLNLATPSEPPPRGR